MMNFLSSDLLPKRLLLVLVVILVLFVLLLIWLTALFQGMSDTAPSDYVSVSMANGAMYFGKLSWFPRPRLVNVWELQRNYDATGQVQLSIAPLQKAFWSPVDELYLNPQNILSWSRLQKGSQVVRALETPGAFRSSQPQVPTEQVPQAATSSPGR